MVGMLVEGWCVDGWRGVVGGRADEEVGWGGRYEARGRLTGCLALDAILDAADAVFEARLRGAEPLV